MSFKTIMLIKRLLHHLFNEKHVTLILCKGSIPIFNLNSNYGTSFLELKDKMQTLHFKDSKVGLFH